MAQWQNIGYGFEKLDLRFISITVGWEGKGYTYNFGNIKAKKTYPTIAEAKQSAIISLLAYMANAQVLLKENE